MKYQVIKGNYRITKRAEIIDAFENLDEALDKMQDLRNKEKTDEYYVIDGRERE